MQRGKNRHPRPMLQGLLGVLMILYFPYLPRQPPHTRPYNRGMLYIRTANTPRQRNSTATPARCCQMLPEIHFNQGNVAYKQQDYGKAREHYTQALQTTDRTLEGKVKFNLGNVEYQQALQNLPAAPGSHAPSALGDDLLS